MGPFHLNQGGFRFFVAQAQPVLHVLVVASSTKGRAAFAFYSPEINFVHLLGGAAPLTTSDEISA